MRVTTETLLERLPHRDPFRFVTRLEDVDPGVAARGVWRVSGREPFLAGHFPDEPVVPGVLIAEALAQVAGLARFAESPPTTRVRLARVDVKFGAPVIPPTEIRLSATSLRSLGDLHLFSVTAEAGGLVVADGTVTLAAPAGQDAAP